MSDDVIEFSLDFTYDGEERPALERAEGQISPGQCIVLCGSSGCGKSTLLRCFNHLIPQFYEGELQGFCRIAGQDLEELTIGETGRLAASVFQDPRSQFFTLNSDTEVAFGLENFGYSQRDMTLRVEEAFRTFHREELRNREVFSLSSGQRQMVAILSAWAADTDVLLLDEPAANLDDVSVRQLAEALAVLKSRGKTLVISEHRLSYLREVADEYWLVENGRIRSRFPTGELLRLPTEALQKLGLRAVDPSSICCTLHAAPPPLRRDTLVIHDLSFRYQPRGPEVLSHMDLTAHTGEVVALTGPNGCGKTTLGKLSAGLLKPDTGTISFNGQVLSGKALSDAAIFIMQEAEFQFFTNSVLHELSYGQDMTPERGQEIEELLRFTGLWELRDRHPFSLSGGQMQKLAMLLACLSPKPLVVLDEPTAGLDYQSLSTCAALIRRMQRDRIVLLISHDAELLSMVCTRSIHFSDPKPELLEMPADFDRLRQLLRETPAPREQPPSQPSLRRPLDPRLKLMLLVMAMLAGVGTDFPLIFSVLLAICTASLWEKNWKLPLAGAGSMGVLSLLYRLWPSVGTSFLVHFFPRVIVILSGAALVLAPREGPRILAGLRAIHVPERVLMIFSVVFRFFPVLHGDLALMNQSVRTRGFFSSLSQKLKAIPEYLEILIVPMVFRVLRIAETLSASAETRGISLPGRRESFSPIHWSTADSCIAAFSLLTAAAAWLL